jgi:hypothetical protein
MFFNDQHQRCEPAAEGARTATDIDGWLASAAWCGWAFEGSFLDIYFPVSQHDRPE